MLVGDRAKYLGIVMGITFASLLITQQAAIFVGLMARTYGSISDLGLPDIWVMDPKVQFIDDIKPLQDTQLLRVRGVQGVDWAVPLYKGLLKVRLEDGTFQTCNVIGLDDATLIGGPPAMIKGKLEDLRRADSVIVDDVGAATEAAHPSTVGKPRPLVPGDTLELNDHRATVVGICKVSRHVPIPADGLHHVSAGHAVRATRTQTAFVRARQGQARAGFGGSPSSHRDGDRTVRLHAAGIHQ